MFLNKGDHWYVIGNLDSGYSELYNISQSKAQSYEIAYKKLRSSTSKADIMKKTKELTPHQKAWATRRLNAMTPHQKAWATRRAKAATMKATKK